MQDLAHLSEGQIVLALSAGLVFLVGAIIVLLGWSRRVASRRAAPALRAPANLPADEAASTPRSAVPLGMIDPVALQDPAIADEPAGAPPESREPVAATTRATALFDAKSADELDASERCSGLLALAQNQLQSGSVPEAGASLREAIVLAAANNLPDQQALARLELGEMARQNGDLITACEHWQIARGLFHDLKNKGRVKAIETRMREHGCPTDWVLNDF